ncbi:MAG: hypothetical protein FWE76_04045 [Symbiobacteriaceae bacterium]|nr:hypothetical protein [Symbiobacteriaceae bacterium]
MMETVLDESRIHPLIRTERLDIVEADGTIKLSIFNGKRIPPPLMDGEDLLPGHRQDWNAAGMIFFNSEGDECGGLLLRSDLLHEGGYRSTLFTTFDQYKNDQVMSAGVSDHAGKHEHLFTLYDRPNEHIRVMLEKRKQIAALTDEEEKQRLSAELRAQGSVRLLMGKFGDGSVGLRMNNKFGKECLALVVDADGEPHLTIRDATGEETITTI